MHIISGKHKGRKIIIHPKHTCRPTTAKVKEAIFNIVHSKLHTDEKMVTDCSFLDICCGSGGVGIEALSRGFENICFIDENRYAIKSVKKNIEILDEISKCNFLITDAMKIKENNTCMKYNIVFIDPPYDKPLDFSFDIMKLLSHYDWLSKDALVFLERPHHKNNSLEAKIEQHKNFSLSNMKVYCNTCIIWYNHNK